MTDYSYMLNSSRDIHTRGARQNIKIPLKIKIKIYLNNKSENNNYFKINIKFQNSNYFRTKVVSQFIIGLMLVRIYNRFIVTEINNMSGNLWCTIPFLIPYWVSSCAYLSLSLSLKIYYKQCSLCLPNKRMKIIFCRNICMIYWPQSQRFMEIDTCIHCPITVLFSLGIY